MPPAGGRVVNVPNVLAIARMFLTFLIMGLLFTPGQPAKAAALGLFLVAMATDWLDGVLARRWNQVTAFGMLLDPIADKVLVIGVLLVFVQLRLVPAWMVLVILLRELIITGVRVYAVSRRIVIPAAKEGKHKATSQMLAITIVLALLFLQETSVGQSALFYARMHQIIWWALWITVILTVYSGAVFFWRNRSLFLDAPSR